MYFLKSMDMKIKCDMIITSELNLRKYFIHLFELTQIFWQLIR